MTIHNSTFSNNEITNNLFGGAIYNFGILDISHSTITLNKAPSGSGAGIYNNDSVGTVQIKNTILSGNTVNGNPADCYVAAGSVLSQGDNLVKTWGNCTAHASDIINTDPRLTPLQARGGATLTHGLLIGSPAVDRGQDLAPIGITTDQRGAKRPDGKAFDIGAFETRKRSVVPFFTPLLCCDGNQ